MGDALKSKAAKVLVILLAACVLQGCRSTRARASFAPTKGILGTIRADKTTRTEVHGLLGQPHSPGAVTDLWEFKLPGGKTAIIEIAYCDNVVTAKRSYNLP